MKMIVSPIGLTTALAAPHALAWKHVLLDEDTAAQNWAISSQDLLKCRETFFGRHAGLHGGRQEGVNIVDINTDAMRISVVPTRGMDVLGAVADNVQIGWNSPDGGGP